MRFIARSFLLFPAIVATLNSAQYGEALDPGDLLQRAAARVRQSTRNLPRFTCIESVRRSNYRSLASDANQTASSMSSLFHPEETLKLIWKDRVRLEVAVFDGRELFSWPGGGRFETPDPGAVAPQIPFRGAASAGEFGPFPGEILTGDADLLSLHFQGISNLSGRRMAEYTYRVPLAESHFTIGTARTGYEGRFWIDPATADLQRLVVDVREPPAETGVRQAAIETDYQWMRVGDAEGLLPQSSALRMLSDNATVAVNTTEWAGCRKFGSESSIRFEQDSGTPESAAVSPSALPPLSPGLVIKTSMLTPIDARTTYAGDAVEARVLDPVKDAGRIVAPKGAILFGKVVRMEQDLYPGRKVILAIQFASVEFDGRSIPLNLASLGPARPHVMPTGLAERVATITVYGTDRLRLDRHVVWYWLTQRF